ncbi:RNA polymerase sigma factor [Okibacterium endophyticum]
MELSLDRVFREHWTRIVAVLARDTGDLGLAEECAQEAFAAAIGWGDAPPENPAGWLYRVARNRAIDRLRRERLAHAHATSLRADPALRAGWDRRDPDAALLETVFGCCHPALPLEAQIALTLRYVAGLSTEQIARAFFVPTATMAKRLVRAKHKIRASGIPFSVPEQLAERLAAVLQVVYLVYNAGHADAGADDGREDLCMEARALAELLTRLLPGEPEALGLAALLEFTDARRPARRAADGRLVLLDAQDRFLWDRRLIERAHARMERATAQRRIGPFQLQAAVAAVHASSPGYAETDWVTVVALYRRLYAMSPSPVVALNLGCALAEESGAAGGLAFIERHVHGLDDYPYLHAARARLLERLGRSGEAARQYERAIALLGRTPEQEDLLLRLAGLQARA